MFQGNGRKHSLNLSDHFFKLVTVLKSSQISLWPAFRTYEIIAELFKIKSHNLLKTLKLFRIKF